jgi:hypothetical protein
MANSRHEKRHGSPHEDKTAQSENEDNITQISERTAEQTTQIGRTAAEAGEEVARAGADVFQQNTETIQNAWRSGLDVVTTLMGRSTDQLGRGLGLSGNEVQQATKRSARNAETIIYSSAAIAKVMSGMSREYFDFVRHQVENNLDRMNELARCRTPQEVTAVQTDLVRDAMRNVLESSRRMADMSIKLAGDATNRMDQNTDAA